MKWIYDVVFDFERLKMWRCLLVESKITEKRFKYLVSHRFVLNKFDI